MPRFWKLNTILIIICLLLIYFSLRTGVFSFSELLKKPPHIFYNVLFHIRLPRTLLAFFVGASLGVSGAVLQGYMRNPLAEASILGVSSMAALGAVLSVSFGIFTLFPYALPLMGIGGAILNTLLLYFLVGRSMTPHKIILVGIAINSLASAAIALIFNLSKNPYALMEIIYWMLGSFADRSLNYVYLLLPFTFLGSLLLFSTAVSLDALSFGTEVAESMGTSMKNLSIRIIIGVGLMVGAAVSVSGIIGFIGLVTPHLLRPFVKNLPGKLLWPSFYGGGILALGADIFVRSLPTQGELKIGVVTALLGSPFFIYLIVKNRHVKL